MKFFVDTNIPMYAAGREHRYRKACQVIINALAEGSIQGVTDTEVLQEILYRYHYINRQQDGWRIYDSFRTIMDQAVLPVTVEDMDLARKLSGKYPDMPPRDLIHVAVMLNNDVNAIISADAHFDQLNETSRVDPLDLRLVDRHTVKK